MEIDDSQSPIRKIMADARGGNYISYKSLDEAKKNKNVYCIMEGDWGGQIYLSIPVNKIKCDEDTLKNLLKEMDKISWECNEGEGSGIYYEPHRIGDGIGGGMGGGLITDGLWVHNELDDIKNQIQEVLNGSTKNLEIK